MEMKMEQRRFVINLGKQGEPVSGGVVKIVAEPQSDLEKSLVLIARGLSKNSASAKAVGARRGGFRLFKRK
ncbi:TPA: hypothetical protein ACG4NT_000107 [Stenotrophomonas maltophilia]